MSIDHSRRRLARIAILLTRGFICAVTLMPAQARGQTDFANTDAGRPLRTQDAIVLERFAFEAHLPNVRWLRSAYAPFALAFEPGLAIGIESRTQLDLGVTVTSRRRSTTAEGAPSFSAFEGRQEGRQLYLEDVHVGVLHQLNVETLGLPAIAVGGAVEVPLQSEERAPIWSAVAAATRTWRGTRAHVNARLTSERGTGADGEPASPWELGVAVDRTRPLRHILFGAELGARRQDGNVRTVDWYTGAGVRWQWTVQTSLDAGVGRTLTNDRVWSVSLGMSTSFGIRSFTGGHR